MNRLLLSVLVMMAICVSVSVSLKCYEGINTFKEVDCPADAVVCATFTGKRNDESVTEKGCFLSEEKPGCRAFKKAVTVKGVTLKYDGEACYCKGDLCNENSTVTSAEVSSTKAATTTTKSTTNASAATNGTTKSRTKKPGPPRPSTAAITKKPEKVSDADGLHDKLNIKLMIALVVFTVVQTVCRQ